MRIVKLGSSLTVNLSKTRFETTVALGYQRRRLRATLRRGGFDVVHYHSIWTPLLPMQVMRCSDSASVVTFHETPPDTFGGALSAALMAAASRLLLARIDGAIAVSEAPRRHLRPKPGQNVWIAPPCTDLGRFRPAADAGERADATVTILCVGRLEPRKGVILLLESFRRLRADGLDVRLVIAGVGSEEARLRRFAERHGLAEVEFTGRFDDEAAPRLYARADIVCAPAPYGESFGIVLCEAMASGKPVVAAANHGYRTVLGADAPELLAPPGDVEGLYRRLRALVLDGDLRARYSAWGAAEALRYDSREVSAQIEDVYRQAIRSSRQPGGRALDPGFAAG